MVYLFRGAHFSLSDQGIYANGVFKNVFHFVIATGEEGERDRARRLVTEKPDPFWRSPHVVPPHVHLGFRG